MAIGQDLRRAKIQEKKLISNCETQPARANSPTPDTQYSPSGKCNRTECVCLLIFSFFQGDESVKAFVSSLISSLSLHALNVTAVFVKESLQTQALIISCSSRSTMEQVTAFPKF